MVANPIPPTLFYSAYPRVCISIAGQELFKNQIIVLYNLCEKREKKFGLPTTQCCIDLYICVSLHLFIETMHDKQGEKMK
jgi:hypothetical protein